MERAKYRLVIPNERYSIAKIFRLFFLLLNGFAMIYVCLVSNSEEYLFYAACPLISAAITWFATKNKKNELGYLEGVSWFLLFVGWWQLEFYWFAGAVAIIAVIGFILKPHFEIKITDNLISINSFPKKEIKWFELNNVVLKDGILTIDFKNDKLIQAEILQDESDIEDEIEFNDYCRSQVKNSWIAMPVA